MSDMIYLPLQHVTKHKVSSISTCEALNWNVPNDAPSRVRPGIAEPLLVDGNIASANVYLDTLWSSAGKTVIPNRYKKILTGGQFAK